MKKPDNRLRQTLWIRFGGATPAPIEDERFLETTDELARRFGGGTLFVFRQDPPRGFWWDKGMVDRDVLA